MGPSPRTPASWMLALGLTTVYVAVWSACRSGSDEDVDPAALFAEAEELRLAHEEESSQRAIRNYRDARAVWIREEDPVRAATASQMLGTTYYQLGLLDDALREYLEAEALCRESCDPLLESAIRSDIGFIQAWLARTDESLDAALEQCRRALDLAHRGGGLHEEAEALSCAGEVEYHRGNLNEALELYRRAESGLEGVADPSIRAERLLLEGAVRSELSQFDEARANLEEAVSLWASSGDERGEAIALIALGRLEHRRGNYQDALNLFRSALDRLDPIGDLIWEASGLGGIAGVYLEMGNGARALSYWEAALETSRKTGVHTATLDLLLAVGNSHLALGDPSEALRSFQEAHELAENTESVRWQAYSLHFMSLAHQSLGKPEESLRSLERALVLQRSAREPRLEASIRAAMGNTYELLGSYERAAENFGQALELRQASNDRVGEAMALFGLARIARARNELDAAREHIEGALRITESLRDEVASREMRTSYFASIHKLHEFYVDVLMRLHEGSPRKGLAAAAFAASERARARSLLESLTEAGVDLRAGVAPDLLARETALKERLDEIFERRAHTSDEEQAEALDDEIRDLQAKYDLVLAEIRSKSPRYAALTRRDPLALEEVQAQLLADDTLLLEYALGKERSYLWAVSKDEYASFELSPRADIEREAARLYEHLTARARVEAESVSERNRRLERADRAYWEAGARLSRMLLGPIADSIAEKRLLVVVDGALQYVPFGGLPVPRSGGEAVPMIVEHEIVNLPSASALAVLRQETLGREQPRGTVAVFADPVYASDDPRLDGRRDSPRKSDPTGSSISNTLHDIGFLRSAERGIPRLEATRQEAAAIVAVVPEGTAFRAMDFDAARSAAMSADLDQYRIVHFATHGVSNVDNPAMSGILLSMFDERGRARDGFLRLPDIYDLDLSADLVVLSACNTALGKQIRGEGMVGIVGAFMYAGAERVVASLWKVDDEATRELMTHFYREMFEAERSPSAALRNAQLAMWREPKWQSPFFWGAFVLQGEWQEG